MRVLVVSTLFALAHAQVRQSVGTHGQQGPALQPLDTVLMQIFDKSHDGKLTLQEVTQSLDGFAAMMGGLGAQPTPGGGPSEMQGMVMGAKKAAPTIFELLDADDSGMLTKAELKWVVKLEKTLKSGALRNLTREVFQAFDTDADDALSPAELGAALDPGGSLDKAVELVHAVFPIRKEASELRSLLLKGMSLFEDELSAGKRWLDTDGNGSIERKEVGQAFAKFKAMFLKEMKTVQEMGPMLAMFGGMDMDGMGAMGAGRGRGGAGRGAPRAS